MPFTEATMAVLAAAGYVRASGRLNRKQAAASIADIMADRHVVTNIDDEAEIAKAATTDELSVEAFGESNPELRFLVAQLTSPLGPVQTNLRNGYMLCTSAVSRPVGQVDGVPVVRKFAARFLTEDPTTIKQTLLDGQVEKLGNGAGRTNVLLALAERRVPALVGYRATLALRVVDRVRAELPSASA